MRDISLHEALELYRRVMEQSGGMTGVRDLGALESALAQARMTFGGEDLYPSLAEKAAAVGFSIISNHPFVDGNKRAAHAIMETLLILNGFEISATVENQERLILQMAAGELERDDLVTWLRAHVVERR